MYFNNYLLLLSTYLQFGLDMKQHPLKLFLFRIISMENTSECIDEKIDGSWKRKMINGNAMGPCKRDFSCIFAYEINSRPTIYGVPLRSLPNLHPHTNQNLVHSTKEKIYIKKNQCIKIGHGELKMEKYCNIVLNNDWVIRWFLNRMLVTNPKGCLSCSRFLILYLKFPTVGVSLKIHFLPLLTKFWASNIWILASQTSPKLHIFGEWQLIV